MPSLFGCNWNTDKGETEGGTIYFTKIAQPELG